MISSNEKIHESNFNKPNVQYCQYCQKECKSLNSLKQHEHRCKKNPNRKDANKLADYIINHRKGKNKFTCEDISKQVNTMKLKYENGYVNPRKGKRGTFSGKHHSEESKQKISESVSRARKTGYANGTITPAAGIGRGKYSYIITNGHKYLMRSTYEFIYALYLSSKKQEFEVEAIRVPALRQNKYSNTFISDFNIDNMVIEIKGIKSEKDIYEKESFEAAGYEFKELFYEDIEKIKNELISMGYDVNGILNNIIKGHNTKNYFVYEA